MKPKTAKTYLDPICGMTVTPENAAGHYEHQGETIYFCSPGCLQKFKQQVESKTAPTLTKISRKSEAPSAFAARI